MQLLDNQRTVMTVKFGKYGYTLRLHSYSSGIHSIQIRRDEGYPIFGFYSRYIVPVSDKYC